MTYSGAQIAATYYNLEQIKQAEQQQEGAKVVTIAYKPAAKKNSTGKKDRRAQQ